MMPPALQISFEDHAGVLMFDAAQHRDTTHALLFQAEALETGVQRLKTLNISSETELVKAPAWEPQHGEILSYLEE